ncbi:NAD(P)H-dependent oxidoreductase [Chakrabartyella piscis]|uniref:flavodoxin family protein n=1 Tax=Chakrabartyella piscis TaxID=2918914 RepID=UPI002958C29F|nr:NAD(P)H-dependent oxidoreductase [Chakrabartyella piscis]
MNKQLTLIYPKCQDEVRSKRLNSILEEILKDYEVRIIDCIQNLQDVQNQRILFAIPVGVSGINLQYYRFLKEMRLKKDMFLGSVGSVLVDGESELYTKSVARELMLTANMAGCAFPGRALVEGTSSLYNFHIQASNLHTDNETAYVLAAKDLLKRLMEFKEEKRVKPRLLVLHASSRKTSNTLTLWNEIEKYLPNWEVREISLQNGTVMDCCGCPFVTCKHFSEMGSCFYGGVITEEIYPAILRADALMILAPNYNDAVSANISAFVNRLTALFRKTAFYNKAIYAIVISGYSGGNIVAEQILGSMSMNKTFRLPAEFAMIETANDPQSIMKVEGIEERIVAYAERMNDLFLRK